MKLEDLRLEFVDRRYELDTLLRLIRTESSRRRVIVLDSPAGMGKTELILEACRRLVENGYQGRAEWRIVRLDFRQRFPVHAGSQGRGPYRNEEQVIEEIARQLCRDARWNDICAKLATADLDERAWSQLREAALIPMEDRDRQALLKAVGNTPESTLSEIKGIIAQAFQDVDIQQAQEQGSLQSIAGLIGFILDKRQQSPTQIPGHVLLILDSIDAIANTDKLRRWVVNELGRGLCMHPGLQSRFKRFAVVVSGRFVEQDLPLATRGREFQEIVLRSFADKTPSVEDLIGQFDDEAFSTRKGAITKLARKLCQVCGGHPRVIKEMAFELYNNPGHFTALDLNPGGVNYWYEQAGFKASLKRYRNTAISEVLEGVEPQKRDLLKLLSVFRKFNAVTLEFLARRMETEGPQEYRHWFAREIKDLYKGLQGTRLIGNDEAQGPFDSDRFSLNLLSAQMAEEEQDLFESLHRWAVELFANWIKGQFSDDPDAPLEPRPFHQPDIAREWLFHRLSLEDCCSDLGDAAQLSEQISTELVEQVLQHIKDHPLESGVDRRRRIRGYLESDQQIDHLIWKIALEGKTRHDTIRDKIFRAFEN